MENEEKCGSSSVQALATGATESGQDLDVPVSQLPRTDVAAACTVHKGDLRELLSPVVSHLALSVDAVKL